VRRERAELFDKIDSKFAALQARVDAVLNPPPPRRAIN
jgi:hypothetical protein